MKVNKLVINGYVIDCGGWFDFDEELRQTSVKIDWGKSESDIITDYLHLMFKHSANQDTGEIYSASVNIVAHCDGVVFVHKPYEMISGANGNAREFIFKGGFVEGMKEEQPKRVKVEYEPCLFADAWEPVKAYCDGELLYCGSKNKVTDPEFALNLWIHGNLYRRIETEITERDEFIQEAMKHGANKGALELGELRLVEKLFDSGKFKLVEGE